VSARMPKSKAVPRGTVHARAQKEPPPVLARGTFKTTTWLCLTQYVATRRFEAEKPTRTVLMGYYGPGPAFWPFRLLWTIFTIQVIVRVLGPRGAFWFGVFVYFMIAAAIAGTAVAISAASHSDVTTGATNDSSPPPPGGGYATEGHASHDDDYYYYTMSWIDWMWGIFVLVIFGGTFFCILYDVPNGGSQMMSSSYEPYYPPPPWYQQRELPVPGKPVPGKPVPVQPVPTRPLLALKGGM
jgi:hypothetical protein